MGSARSPGSYTPPVSHRVRRLQRQSFMSIFMGLPSCSRNSATSSRAAAPGWSSRLSRATGCLPSPSSTVGLCGVLPARRLGAEQIIMLGRHADRIALARKFGATDVVSERGDAAIERVRELTSGLGAHSVLECVGHGESMRTAVSIARAGGAVGRVGVPQETTIPNAQPTFYANITVAGGPAPVRAYMHALLPDADRKN